MASLFLGMRLKSSQFTSLDFDQAMVHVKGVWMVVAARGGISTLEGNQDLILMISWYGSSSRTLCLSNELRWVDAKQSRRVDITAALLHDTKPLFPLSPSMASARVYPRTGLETLPRPLLSVINDGNTQDARFTSEMSCIGDLNALATLLQAELATKGDAIWDDEERMGFLVNPVTHHLLDQQPTRPSEPTTRCDVVSEALRLGAIIWIIRMKRRCCSYPGTAEARISTLLKIEVMSDVRRMPWIDIFELPCAELGQRLMENYL